MHAFAVGQRLEMAGNVVARCEINIAAACRTFGVSKTCNRYGPKLRAENEETANLLTGLNIARKTWGLAFVFLAPAQRERPFVDTVTRQCKFSCVRGHKCICHISCDLDLNLRPHMV